MSKQPSLSTGWFWWGAAGLALLVMALDSISKYHFWQQLVAGQGRFWRWSFFHFTVQLNHGVAFSLPLTGWWLAAVLVVVLAVLFWFVRYHVRASGRLPQVAVGLLVGGALGNLVTRAWLDGAVVDFIGVGSFPLFNLADSAITVSAVLLILFWPRIAR